MQEKGHEGDPFVPAPARVNAPPDLSETQWQLAEVAARAAESVPLWMVDPAVDAVARAARRPVGEDPTAGGSGTKLQPGPGDWSRVSLDELRAAIGLPAVPLDSNELASGGADAGRFRGIEGVL